MMENIFLGNLINNISTAFESLAVIKTRQALISFDDHTSTDIGYTRQQVLNGDLYNATDLVDSPVGKLGEEKSVQDNKFNEREAA